MKKLAVVALALVIAMSFVGCGLANQLVGTKWENKVIGDYYGYDVTATHSLEFKEDNKVVEIYSIWANDLAYEVDGGTYTGTWTVDGEELTLKYDGYVAEVYTAVIDGDKLILTDKADSTKEEFTRVK